MLFADDQAIIPSLEEGLQVIINKLNGRRINTKTKTEQNKERLKIGQSEKRCFKD